MTISTYADLKTSIASWINRTDLTSVIPDFITLTEARINRTLLPRSSETEEEIVAVPGSRYIVIPTGMINPVALWLKAYLPRQKLTQMLPAELPVKTNATGYPEYWAIDNSNIALDKIAGEAYTFDFRYTKTFALSDSVTTNYVLTNNPDVYLWGSLVEAAGYLKDAQAAALYESRFQNAMSEAMANENDTRATAPLMTEIGAVGRQGRFSIIRGY